MSPAAPHRRMPFIARVRVDNCKPIAQKAAVLSNRKFEAWSLISAPSFGGRSGLAEYLKVPAKSETFRDKGWLTHRRRDGVRYRPRVDQAALTQDLDLEIARPNSPSFNKFCRDITYLITGKRGE